MDDQDSATEKKRGIDMVEALSDVPKAIDLAKSAVAAANSLPKNPKGVDYARAFGIAEGTPLMKFAELVDTIVAQGKD